MAKKNGILIGALYILSGYLAGQVSAQVTAQPSARPALPSPFNITGKAGSYFTSPDTSQARVFRVGETMTVSWQTAGGFQSADVNLNIGDAIGKGEVLAPNSTETSFEWTVDDFGAGENVPFALVAIEEGRNGESNVFASGFFWIESGDGMTNDDSTDGIDDETTTSRISATRTAVVTRTAVRSGEAAESTASPSSLNEDQDASISQQQVLSSTTSMPTRQNSTMSTAIRIATSSTATEETALPSVLVSPTSTRYVMEPETTGEATLFDSDDETPHSTTSISTTSAAAIGLGAGLGLLVLLLVVIFVVAAWYRERKRKAEGVKEEYSPEKPAGCNCGRHCGRPSSEMSEESLPRGIGSPVGTQRHV